MNKANLVSSFVSILALSATSSFASPVSPVSVEGSTCTYTLTSDEASDTQILDVSGEGYNARFSIPNFVLPLARGLNVDITRVNQGDPNSNTSLSYKLGYLRATHQGHTDFIETKKLVLKVDPSLQNPKALWVYDGMAGIIPLAFHYCKF